MDKGDILLADGGGEWFLYKTSQNKYVVRYTKEFYMRRGGMLPSFDIGSLVMEEEVSEDEAKEIWRDIRDYYGTAYEGFGGEEK